MLAPGFCFNIPFYGGGLPISAANLLEDWLKKYWRWPSLGGYSLEI